jgi:hypothetical protein
MQHHDVLTNIRGAVNDLIEFDGIFDFYQSPDYHCVAWTEA